MGYAVSALGALGEGGRARDWARRALLIDPDNMNMRYNLACALSGQLKDAEGGAGVAGTVFYAAGIHDKSEPRQVSILTWIPYRNDLRFMVMITVAETRLAATEKAHAIKGLGGRAMPDAGLQAWPVAPGRRVWFRAQGPIFPLAYRPHSSRFPAPGFPRPAIM